MKITFQGSLDEFRAVFGTLEGFVEVSTEEIDGEIPPPAPPLTLVTPAKENKEEKAEGEIKQISPDVRAAAWDKFKQFCFAWLHNFDIPDTEQPDRLELIRDLGSGKHTVAILVMAYEMGSLQRLVEKALVESGVIDPADYEGDEAYLDFLEKVTGHMIQISHMGFPDLVGTYDYSSTWKRKKQ